MGATLTTLIVGNPDIDFRYEHKNGELEYRLDTKEIRASIKSRAIGSKERKQDKQSNNEGAEQ